MTTIFISGSISIKKLDDEVINRLKNIMNRKCKVIIGDANGVDSMIQNIMSKENYKNVEVYCSGKYPRNNIGKWNVKNVYTNAPSKSRSFYTAKDLLMAHDCEYGMMVWDEKSKGTLKNVEELTSQQKKSIVYFNKRKRFIKISTEDDLMKLKIDNRNLKIHNHNKELNFETLENKKELKKIDTDISLHYRKLMIKEINKRLLQNNITQTQAARILGVTQPRISDLVREHADKFSLDFLVNVSEAAGIKIELKFQ